MELVELFKNKTECCGCSACYNVCPTHAIEMTEDKYGFVYPIINHDICIKCKMCLSVCNYKKNHVVSSQREVYASSTTDTDVLESASGGLFSSIAQSFINDCGYVYGSTMIYENKQFTVKHICIHDLDDLIKLKGSKYVQSDLTNMFKDIKEKLENNHKVLFSGTPCQVDGLYGYLKKDYENLYTIDIICHGVPNIKFFNDYVKYIENKFKIEIIDFKFRDKHDGWKLLGKIKYITSDYEVKEKCFEPEESSYYQMFLNSYTYRENCYTCPYACDKRPGNITIGDYWCIDLVHPEYLVEHGGLLDEKKGVSTLVVNNAKGNKLVELYGSSVRRYESSYTQAYTYNKQLIQPSLLKEEREVVMNMYIKKDYDIIERWYQKRLRKIKLNRYIRSLIPRKAKDVIKKMIGR